MKEIYKEIGKKYNLPSELVKKVYTSQYKFIYEELKKKDNLNKTFPLQRLGKIKLNLERYKDEHKES